LKRRIYLACFTFHFLLILGVCTRDTLSLLANGYTDLPASLQNFGTKAEAIVAAALGESLTARNPLRQGIVIYQNASGIDVGYGFFAPSVPNSYKLVFEIHYPNGEVEYDLPRVNDVAGGAAVSSLLNQIGRMRYDPLRKMALKMLTYSEWREHPNASIIRVVFGFVGVPSPTDVRLGKQTTYQFLYAYDFSFPPNPAEQ
jgi:hypothetical protein